MPRHDGKPAAHGRLMGGANEYFRETAGNGQMKQQRIKQRNERDKRAKGRQQSQRRRVRIIGTGRFLPGKPLTNPEVLDLCQMPSSVTCEWIDNRVKIRTRHCARKLPFVDDALPAEGMHNSDMAAAAVRNALEMCQMKPSDIDLLIVATCTPDFPVPSTATLVQDKLGVPEIAAMDIRSACCGTTQAIVTAMNFLENGYYRTAVVVGSEIGSVFGDVMMPADAPKMECVNIVMMGDGAGAIVLTSFPAEDEDGIDDEDLPGMEVVYTRFNSIGAGKPPGMWLPAGGSSNPLSQRTLDLGLHRFKHSFREVLQHGPELYLRAIHDTTKAMGYTFDDIDCFIPHQANGQVPDIAAKLGIPKERIYHNFNRVGNTANASLLICLDELVRGDTTDGSEQPFRLWPGANVLMVAAESTKWLYGAILIRYKPLANEQAAAAVQRKRRPMSLWQKIYGSFVMRALNAILSTKRLLGY